MDADEFERIYDPPGSLSFFDLVDYLRCTHRWHWSKALDEAARRRERAHRRRQDEAARRRARRQTQAGD